MGRITSDQIVASAHQQGRQPTGSLAARGDLLGLAALAAQQCDQLLVQPALRLRQCRMRRVGIVAMARRLAIALWRYLQDGEIPVGAHPKVIAV